MSQAVANVKQVNVSQLNQYLGLSNSILIATILSIIPWIQVVDQFSLGAVVLVGGFSSLILSGLSYYLEFQRIPSAVFLSVLGLWTFVFMVVITGIFNPLSLEQIGRDKDLTVILTEPAVNWLPSSANAATTVYRLPWFAGGLILALAIYLMPQRYFLGRLVLWAVILSATIGAIAGIYYKLQGADALLGRYPKGRGEFFGLFIYPNHYVLYSTLSICACVALFKNALFQARRHSKLYTLSVLGASSLLGLIISFSLPLTRSRSGILILALFVFVILIRNMVLRIRFHKERNRNPVIPLWTKLTGICVICIVILSGVIL